MICEKEQPSKAMDSLPSQRSETTKKVCNPIFLSPLFPTTCENFEPKKFVMTLVGILRTDELRYLCNANYKQYFNKNLNVMKTSKLFGIVAGLLLIGCLASCQKEKAGAYTPKKKIQRMYYAEYGEEKQPFQHWDWNGDQLSSITHYTDIDMKGDTWIENFTYENDRITRVDNYTHQEYITYDYDGDHLKTATVYYENEIVCTWNVTYDGNHISKMSGILYDYKKHGHEMRLNPLTHLLPYDICNSITQCEQKTVRHHHSKDAFNITLLLTWTNDNLSKIVLTGEDEYEEFQLHYDDKNCPFYGFMGGFEDYLTNFSTGHTGFTRHNVTALILNEDYYSDSICYAYQYDKDKYPVLQTLYYADEPDYKQVLYYEY